MIRAIRTVAEGGVYLDPSIAGLVTNGYTNTAPVAKDGERLSTREHEGLLDVAYGFTNKEIADRLHISVKTVEGYKPLVLVSETKGSDGKADITVPLHQYVVERHDVCETGFEM